MHRPLCSLLPKGICASLRVPQCINAPNTPSPPPNDVWPIPPIGTTLVTMSFSRWILIAALVVLPAGTRAQSACYNGLPDALRSAVEQDTWKIVQSSDLSEADQRVWRNNHPTDCAGLAVGNFSPRAKQSFIVALIQRDGQNNLLEKVDLVYLKKNPPVVEDAITTLAVAT